MTPALLAVVQMQGFESLLYRLVTGETSPLVVTSAGTELGLGEVGLGLMQPIG